MRLFKFKVPSFLQILIGMILGVFVGFLFHKFGYENIVINWIKPFGTIFINALKMVAIPLVFVSLLKGILGVKNIKELSNMGLRTIVMYISTTFIAVILGLVAVNIVKPGDYFPEDKSAQFMEQVESSTLETSFIENSAKEGAPLDFLVDIVPDNFTGAMSDNSKMLQVIFLSILVGVAVLSIGTQKMKSFVDVVNCLDEIILKIIDYIMLCAPYGVFALMSALFVDTSGDVEVFTSLGIYAATVIGSLMIIIFVIYPLMVMFFSDIKPKKFFKTMLPVQLVAFSTSSSAATLPVTMEKCEKELGLSQKVTSFVLPVGVTINMDGTSCYQAVAILFIAQVMGIELSFAQMLSITFLAVLSSIGSPGVPGASIVMTVMILTTVGIPAEGLILILGIDRPLDMIRTMVNVTGDVAVTSIIDKTMKCSV